MGRLRTRLAPFATGNSVFLPRFSAASWLPGRSSSYSWAMIAWIRSRRVALANVRLPALPFSNFGFRHPELTANPPSANRPDGRVR